MKYVFRIFNPTAEPDEIVLNAQLCSLLWCLIPVRDNCGLLHQAFTATKGRCNVRDSKPINKPGSGLQVSNNLKTDNTTKATHLELGNIVLWMTLQAWIMYTCHLRVGLQCSCKLESSCILLPDTDAKSLQSSQNKVCGIRVKNASQDIVQGSYRSKALLGPTEAACQDLFFQQSNISMRFQRINHENTLKGT
jgi:hypothetical protein